MERLIFSLITAVCFTFHSVAIDYTYPKDVGTLEALIALHKACAKGEKTARDNVAQISATQALTTSVTDKFNNVRMTLNSKLECANQWMTLASSLMSTGTDIYKLIGEIEDFTTDMPHYVGQNPMCAVIYSDAIIQLNKEVKTSLKNIAKLELSAANILRADMKQRLNMVFTIQMSISRCRRVLNMTRFRCIGLTYRGRHLELMDFEYLMRSKTLEKISAKIRNDWTR